MTDALRPLKALRYRIFYGALLRRYELVELGNRATGCQWRFCPNDLNANSVIYSGGVGRDVTFEHALVKNYGSKIVLFDPSPTGLETMALPENKIPQFTHHAVGLAGNCGTLKFAPPKEAHEGSWFMADTDTATIEVPCVDLATLMARNGHTHIDLLKIDIEGAEYGVLDDLLRRKLRVRQVLVEFHHQMLPGVRRSQTIRAILKMVAAGYQLIDQYGSNHAFYRQKF